MSSWKWKVTTYLPSVLLWVGGSVRSQDHKRTLWAHTVAWEPMLQQTLTESLLCLRLVLCGWLPAWDSVRTAAWFFNNVTKQSRFYVEEIRTFSWRLVYSQSLPGAILFVGPQIHLSSFFFKNCLHMWKHSSQRSSPNTACNNVLICIILAIALR